ncbi:MAG TPA: dTDP-4-dehydrorhamnose 3,5-epimerase [Candidatus Angelobacter sp.]|jgi:dTDP-4-dehydrorhamnose 3,5-epimerase|nr:dTDP-4-dehydrorhamnose 3,5-epimerase [Candidatus Angelobacter sp.]
MSFKIESIQLNEIVIIAPEVHGDARGFFMETFRADQFRALGLPVEFPQDNHSRSSRAVLRGLHIQWDPPMSKLMRVTNGSAFLVAVDVRKGSPTLGKWFGTEVSAENKKQIWAPYGFARGFCALTDACEIQYKCTAVYNPQGEGVIHFADPGIGIDWPIDAKTVVTSDRDRHAQTLAQWLASPLSENVLYDRGKNVSKQGE